MQRPRKLKSWCVWIVTTETAPSPSIRTITIARTRTCNRTVLFTFLLFACFVLWQKNDDRLMLTESRSMSIAMRILIANDMLKESCTRGKRWSNKNMNVKNSETSVKSEYIDDMNGSEKSKSITTAHCADFSLCLRVREYDWLPVVFYELRISIYSDNNRTKTNQ